MATRSRHVVEVMATVQIRVVAEEKKGAELLLFLIFIIVVKITITVIITIIIMTRFQKFKSIKRPPNGTQVL